MRPAIITYAAKRTAAIVIAGSVVVATGSFALASSHEEEPVVDDPIVDPVEEVCDPDVDECPADEACDPDVDECPADEACDPDVDECPTEDEEPALEDHVSEDEEEPVLEEVEGEYKNHGQAVSEAARETCPRGEGHGACVSDVARSDVGKKSAPETEEPETVEEDETVEEPVAQNAEAGTKGNNGQGKGAYAGVQVMNAGGNSLSTTEARRER